MTEHGAPIRGASVARALVAALCVLVAGCGAPGDRAAPARPVRSPPTATVAARPIATPARAPVAAPPDRTIDDFAARCPTAAEVAQVRADLLFEFVDDPTGPTLRCTAATGSADLTLLQWKAYQAALAMRAMRFDAPLPWTAKPLYDWFKGAVRGVRFRPDDRNSFCCSPAGIINVGRSGRLAAVRDPPNVWIAPDRRGGLDSLMLLYVHEARHNEGKHHNCSARPASQGVLTPLGNLIGMGPDDRTLSEMGGWGVQYYTLVWLADHSDPEFYRPARATTPAERLRYQRLAREEAASMLGFYFCDPR